jgi:hypothetical protein
VVDVVASVEATNSPPGAAAAVGEWTRWCGDAEDPGTGIEEAPNTRGSTADEVCVEAGPDPESDALGTVAGGSSPVAVLPPEQAHMK